LESGIVLIAPKTKEMKKVEEIELTQHEWFNSLKVPTPHRNKKKYFRKEKHKKGWNSEG